MILALDLSSKNVGYAFGGPSDSMPRSGAWQLPGGSDLPRCCAILHSSVSGLCGVIHPSLVVVEAPLVLKDRFHGGRPLVVLLALYGAALAAASRAGAPCEDAHVQTWRKHFIGHGNLPGEHAKAAAMERCRILGWNAESHDQAEACGIWAWSMANRYPQWSPKSTPLFGRKEVA